MEVGLRHSTLPRGRRGNVLEKKKGQMHGEGQVGMVMLQGKNMEGNAGGS